MERLYAVEPGRSWGRLPMDKRRMWQILLCDCFTGASPIPVNLARIRARWPDGALPADHGCTSFYDSSKRVASSYAEEDESLDGVYVLVPGALQCEDARASRARRGFELLLPALPTTELNESEGR